MHCICWLLYLAAISYPLQITLILISPVSFFFYRFRFDCLFYCFGAAFSPLSSQQKINCSNFRSAGGEWGTGQRTCFLSLPLTLFINSKTIPHLAIILQTKTRKLPLIKHSDSSCLSPWLSASLSVCHFSIPFQLQSSNVCLVSPH